MSIFLFWHLSDTPQFVFLIPWGPVLWLCVYGENIALQLPVSIPSDAHQSLSQCWHGCRVRWNMGSTTVLCFLLTHLKFVSYSLSKTKIMKQIYNEWFKHWVCLRGERQVYHSTIQTQDDSNLGHIPLSLSAPEFASCDPILQVSWRLVQLYLLNAADEPTDFQINRHWRKHNHHGRASN